MPTIPRYQPRGGPSVGGLNYAGAYSPPDGSDLRTLARVADAAGGVFGLFQQKPKPARTARPKGADAPQAPPDGPAAPRVEDHLLGKAGDVTWRRNHITADIDALDPEVVRQSRQQVAEALSPGARKVFDMLTLSREGGFMAAVAARAGDRVREARRAVSLERQTLGVEEFHALIDTAPEQAMAALGSATGELAARMRDDGAGQDEIRAAQRELVSQAKVQCIETLLAADPQRAAGLLQDEPMIGDAERLRLADEISLEIRRRQVLGEVAAMAAEHERLADEPEAFLRRVLSAGGENADLYAGAAIGEIREALARRMARDEAAWNAVSPLLDSGEVRTWTDLPSGVWRRLSSEQQQQVRDRLDQTIPLAAEGPLLARANLASGDAGESLLVPAAFQPEADPSLSWGFGDDDRQTRLTAQDKAVNLALSKRPFADGLIVDAETGQVVRPRIRARPGLSLQAGKGDFEVVTNYEAQQFRERRLGARSHRAGMMSPEEQIYRRDKFSDVKEDAAPGGESADSAKRPLLEVFGPRNYKIQPGDELTLARMIFAEGAGTPGDHAAIGWSIMNRVGHREHGDSLTAVLRDRNGFQIVPEGGGPTGGSDLWRMSANPEALKGPNRLSWENAVRVANGILSGEIPDPVDGGRFFYASSTVFDGRVNTVKGGWFRSAYKTGKIVAAPYKSQATGERKNYFFKDR